MWKVYNDDYDVDNNDDGQRTNCDQKSSLEPSGQLKTNKLLFYTVGLKWGIICLVRFCKFVNCSLLYKIVSMSYIIMFE